MSDQDIRAEFQDNYNYAQNYYAPYIRDARTYSLAAAGNSWSNQERKALIDAGRTPLEYNITRRPLNFYSGYLRDNLNSVIISPVEGSDNKTADQFTKLSYNDWDKGHGYDIFLDTCDEAFKAGLSLCGIYMDYRKDFLDGDVRFYKRTFNSFYLDPTFEQLDLSDCSFAIMRDLINKDLIKSLLPFVDPKVIDDCQSHVQDDKFLSYHPNFTWLAKNKKVCAYDQYYKKTTKNRTYLIDESNGYYRDITDLSDDEMKDIKRGIYRIHQLHGEAQALGLDRQQLPAKLNIRNVEREFVELNILINGHPVYTGADKTGIVERFPFVPILCYFEPAIWDSNLRFQGIPATTYCAHREFNKRHMKITDMMDSVISTGYKYLIGSVPDVSDMQQTGQNKIIGVSADPDKAPNGLESVQELKGGNADQSIIQYSEVLDNLTLQLANINESVLGADEGGNTQISGRLAETRIAQGLRSNRKVFDNISQSQRLLGSLVMEAQQNNYSPGKVKRILGEEPTQQFYDQQFEQYDACVKEGIRSQTQKDAYYYELVNLKRDGIVNVPEGEIVRALQISGIEDLQKSIEEQQMQQQQMEAAQMQKQTELVDATAKEKLSLSHERDTRADSNIGLAFERRSEHVQNLAQAELDRAKAITEIAKLDDSRLTDVLKELAVIREQEQAEAERVRQQANFEAEIASKKAEREMQPAQQPNQPMEG